MTKPTDAELDAVLCNQWPAFSTQATLVRVWVRAAMRDALAKFGTPPAVAGEPAGRVVSANCQYATVGWHRQTSEVGGGDPDNSRSWPITGDAVYLTPQPTQAQAGAVPLAMCRGFARAIEAEVRKDDEALIRQMLEALDSCDPGLYMGTNGSDTPYYDARKVGAAIANARARLAPPPPTA